MDDETLVPIIRGDAGIWLSDVRSKTDSIFGIHQFLRTVLHSPIVSGHCPTNVPSILAVIPKSDGVLCELTDMTAENVNNIFTPVEIALMPSMASAINVIDIHDSTLIKEYKKLFYSIVSR